MVEPRLVDKRWIVPLLVFNSGYEDEYSALLAGQESKDWSALPWLRKLGQGLWTEEPVQFFVQWPATGHRTETHPRDYRDSYRFEDTGFGIFPSELMGKSEWISAAYGDAYSKALWRLYGSIEDHMTEREGKARLRNNIYDLVLEEDLSSPIDLSTKQPAITRTCRQMRREALPMVEPKLAGKAWDVPLVVCGSMAAAERFTVAVSGPAAYIRLSIAPWLHCMEDLRTEATIKFQVHTATVSATASTQSPPTDLQLTPFGDGWFSTHARMPAATLAWLEKEHRRLHWGLRWAADRLTTEVKLDGQGGLTLEHVERIVERVHSNRRTPISRGSRGPMTQKEKQRRGPRRPYRPFVVGAHR
ncbi:hypothetical protein LTR36_006187 [Oleoguttula mirabilis]|uniref:Uncharacterized protein n=1 Tax=Oleoguttula mirabilis TaxID=1507867 RepID=A0AAV9JCG0_9PEZI|nr:hypothetical protein LTR36_006187 [Oleoguttula mirabilis]